MNKWSLIFLICYNCAFCQVRQNEEIVIVFKDKPQFETTIKYSNGAVLSRTALITLFYDHDEDRVEFKPNEIPLPIILRPKSSHAILRHYINYFDFNDYVLNKGDTILIDYGSKLLRVQNTKAPQAEYEVENIVRSSFSFGDFSPIGKYFEPMALFGQKLFANKKMLSESGKLGPKQILERNIREQFLIKKELKGNLDVYLARYTIVLDSLKKLGQISEVAFQFYQRKVMIIEDLSNLETNQMSENQINEILLKYDVFTDSYEDIYYRNLLVAFIDKYIAQKAIYMDLKDGRNRDSREVYRLIRESSIMTNRAKELMLTREMNRINAFYSKQDFKEYFQYYERDVNNKDLVATIRERYIMTLEEDVFKQDVGLVTVNKQKTTLRKLIESHKGKVVYVDFWASWCAPCRAAMPQSAKLREGLKDKNVAFVYLSIDKAFDAWKKASAKEGLAMYPNNFLVLNADVSEFMKQQKITSIPRYMIFDKTGKLTYPNAPRVENKDLVGVLLEMTK